MSPVSAGFGSGFRVGIYLFKDAEVIDYAAPYGVFSVARRYHPSLDVFLVAHASRPIQTQAGLTVIPGYTFNNLAATSRKEGDNAERSKSGLIPIERLAQLAPAARISRARVVDAGRIITAGGIASGMELGFHLLRRAGYRESFIDEVAPVMEYREAYDLYRDDIETTTDTLRERRATC